MTVKVNLDHLQNEIALKLRMHHLPLLKISCKSMHNFLREAAHRQTDGMANKPTWLHGGGN